MQGNPFRSSDSKRVFVRDEQKRIKDKIVVQEKLMQGRGKSPFKGNSFLLLSDLKSVVRSACNDEKPDEKCIVFDGCNSFLINALLKAGKHVLLVGNTGTGFWYDGAKQSPKIINSFVQWVLTFLIGRKSAPSREQTRELY